MNKTMKLFVTDFRKMNLYGDGMAVSETETIYPFRGRRIDVKILGLFWLTYSYYTVKPNYNF